MITGSLLVPALLGIWTLAALAARHDHGMKP